MTAPAPPPRLLLLAAFAGALLARPAAGYDIVGPNKCMGCHDHDPQKDWAEKKEGPKGHLNALSQLEDKKSAGWGKAIGLADVYDIKGTCVKCHATVFKGDANAGVSCETCHGPGSGYLEPHQKKGAYKDAVALGMYDTRGNLPVWAKMCISCHVMTDKKLVDAGHPPGRGFDLSVKSFGQVVHWKDSYDKAALGAAGRAAEAKLTGGAPPPAPPAKEAAKEAPKAEPTKPPAKAEAPKPEAPKEAAKKEAPKPEAPKAEAPKAEAPKSEQSKPEVAKPTPKPEAPKEQPKAEAKPETKPAAPAPPAEAPTPPPTPMPLPTAVAAPVGGGPMAESAAARGRLLVDLAKAVQDGKAWNGASRPPAPATDYSGPDGALLRLQDEVLALELTALAPSPAPSTTPKEKRP